jgi:hypothetical protein
MTIAELQCVALELLHRCHGLAREMAVDRQLALDLDAEFGPLTRQHHVKLYRSQRPARIDFRLGGTNPVLIELAVRPEDGASQLYGSQNRPELEKLTRVPQRRAKLRALLLMDLKQTHLPLDRLKQTYDCVSAGPGRFERNPVQVLYVHKEAQYHFSWRP